MVDGVKNNTTFVQIRPTEVKANVPDGVRVAGTDSRTSDSMVASADQQLAGQAQQLASNPSGTLGTPGVSRFAAAPTGSVYSVEQVSQHVQSVLDQNSVQASDIKIHLDYDGGALMSVQVTSNLMTDSQRDGVAGALTQSLQNHPVSTDNGQPVNSLLYEAE